jgi:mono/diheme cytochrome c family protein
MTANLSKPVLVLGGSIVVVALVVAFVWLDRQPPSGLALDPNDSASVALGEEIYVEQCAACHGESLEGQDNWQDRQMDGRLPAPPHDASGHTWHHPDQVLFDLMKYGPAALIGGDYESDMPGYEDTLSDADIVAVLSYIKSQWPAEIKIRHDQVNAQYRDSAE